MNDNLDALISRRSLLRCGSCAALGLGGLTSQMFTMRSLAAALDGGTFDDYRALVCIFLFGGNDSGNTLIPWDGGDQNHADYAAARTTIAIPAANLAGSVIAPDNTSGRRFALHPSMAGTKSLFDSGNMAIASNVGTLLYPINRQQYIDRTVPVPNQLKAHNAQQEQWQLSRPDATDGIGWGGRIADLVQANGANPDATVSMNISIAGQSRFLAGNQVTPYAVGPSGPEEYRVSGPNSQRLGRAYLDMLAVQDDPSHPASTRMGKVVADVTRRAAKNGALIRTLLESGTAITATPPEGNGLADQLAMAARLIEFGEAGLGHQRQVFFVSLGGFDNHDGLIGETPATGPHADNLARIDTALTYFWEALGQIGMRDSVTTFTASDFGRKYVSNGDGSDHGWSGHHFVMGGAVNGGRLYGDYPNILPGGPSDSGNGGSFIPTTSVDAYGFELARWMGVPLSEMNTVFPNIDRFLAVDDPATHLGFLG